MDMNDEGQATEYLVVKIVRWIALLPAALLSSYLTYFLMGWAVRYGLAYADIRADSIIVQIFDVTLVHACMGAIFVYVGTSLAPALRPISSLVLGCTAIAIACFLSFFAFQAEDWWALISAISIIVGAIILVIAIRTSDVELAL